MQPHIRTHTLLTYTTASETHVDTYQRDKGRLRIIIMGGEGGCPSILCIG